MIWKNMDKNSKIRPEILICLFLVIATLAVYWQLRNYEFVGFDDDVFIIQNSKVQNGLSLESIRWAFSYDNMTYWHPLTWLSYMLDIQFYGMNPGGHHMTNVLLHIVNAILLFIIFNKMSGALWRSAVVAALFALHPLNVESVAWVVERKNVLSTLFWMLTLLTYNYYAERPKFYRYVLTLGMFVLGLMAKPMLVTLPFVLLLLDFWPLKRLHFQQLSGNHPKSARFLKLKRLKESGIFALFLEKIPFLIFSGISVYLSFLSMRHRALVIAANEISLYHRITNALISYVSYIGKMFWPRNLAVFYPFPDRMQLWEAAGAFFLLISVSIVVMRSLKKQPYLGVGWLWYLGTLFPVIGLVQAGLWPAMADRFVYVPLVGLFVVMAWGIPDLAAGWRYKVKGLGTMTAVVLLILMTTSWLQVRYWKNSVLLFKHAVEVTDNNYIMHNNLGFALTARGRPDEAIKHYKEALRINPDFEQANINIGLALLSQGKFDECVDYYQEVLRVKPDYAKVHNNLGAVFWRLGKTEEATIHFQEAVLIDPNYAEAHNSLGAALVFKGKNGMAIAHLQEALRLKPDYALAERNLSKAIAAQKQIGDANRGMPRKQY
jgi:tetratricopeptide (TPR) repeat protein